MMGELSPIGATIRRTRALWYWQASQALRGRLAVDETGRALSRRTALACMRSLARGGGDPLHGLARRNLASIGLGERREGAA